MRRRELGELDPGDGDGLGARRDHGAAVGSRRGRRRRRKKLSTPSRLAAAPAARPPPCRRRRPGRLGVLSYSRQVFLDFRDLNIDQDMVDALASKGIIEPFPIQTQTIPLALAGQDIIGQAKTGTGKTLRLRPPAHPVARPRPRSPA